MRCWDTLLGDGTAFAAFMGVRSSILDCLENHPKLNQAEKTFAAGLTCCLVGSEPKAVNPAIVVHCEDEPYRKRAMKVINRQHWWRSFECKHPSFILLTSRRAPTPATSPDRQISVDPAITEVGQHITPGPTTTSVFAEPSSGGRCGVAAEFQLHQVGQPLSERRIATLGGYINVDGKLCGLTVAHAFANTGPADTGDLALQRTPQGDSTEWDVDAFEVPSGSETESQDDDLSSDESDDDGKEGVLGQTGGENGSYYPL